MANKCAKKPANKAEVKKEAVAPVVEAKVNTTTEKKAPVAKKPVAAKKPAAAKKPVAKKDNKVAVEFNIEVVDPSVEVVYVCGSAKEVGAWDAAKALEIKKNADGKFVKSVKFNKDEVVEFKVLKAMDWAKVEKGMQCEEINNHSVFAAKDAKAELVVYNWAE